MGPTYHLHLPHIPDVLRSVMEEEDWRFLEEGPLTTHSSCKCPPGCGCHGGQPLTQGPYTYEGLPDAAVPSGAASVSATPTGGTPAPEPKHPVEDLCDSLVGTLDRCARVLEATRKRIAEAPAPADAPVAALARVEAALRGVERYTNWHDSGNQYVGSAIRDWRDHINLADKRRRQADGEL